MQAINELTSYHCHTSTLSSSSCVKPSKPPITRTTSARLFSGVLKYPISMFFTRDLTEKQIKHAKQVSQQHITKCLRRRTGPNQLYLLLNFAV